MPRGRRKRKAAAAPDANLTKGQLRKLNALKKSLGDEIAERAFAEWLETQGGGGNGIGADKNALAIYDAVMPLIEQGVRIPRGGYLLRRGRGRIIIERPTE